MATQLIVMGSSNARIARTTEKKRINITNSQSTNLNERMKRLLLLKPFAAELTLQRWPGSLSSFYVADGVLEASSLANIGELLG